MQSNTQFIKCILLCQLIVRSSNYWRLCTFRNIVRSSSFTSLCLSLTKYVYSVLVDSGFTHRRRTNVLTPCRHPGSGDEPAELQPSNALRTWSVVLKYYAKYSDLCLEYCARCSVSIRTSRRPSSQEWFSPSERTMRSLFTRFHQHPRCVLT